MERLTGYYDGRAMLAPEPPSNKVLLEQERIGGGLVGFEMITGEVITRLAQYEDEEEQGRLIRLPCPMNTKIYLIVTKRARSYSTKQFRFIKTSQLTWRNLETVLRNFGKTVFLDHNEAEAAMERMNKEDEDGRNH